jgi:succinate-semialdehyde dehydrogenase/glutarate-semialdehyde dehydrogenase
MLIAGELCISDRIVPVLSPASDAVIGHAPNASVDQTRAAIAAAQQASDTWARTGPRERGRRLESLADHLQDRSEALARILALETGKRLAEARAEISLSVEFLRWFAGEGRRADGTVVPSPGVDKSLAVVVRPRGPAALLVPWNFPVSILVRKLAAALASGSTVVARPSSIAPLAALELGEIVLAADIPPGVVNLISGDIKTTAAPLIDDHRIRTVSFTGSTEIGRTIARRVSSRLGHVALELGGDAPFLVFDDADLDLAVEQALIAKLRNNGQSCIAMNRLLVQKAIADRFLGDLELRFQSISVGDPLVEHTTLGPVISRDAANRLRAWVDHARSNRSLVVGTTSIPAAGPAYVNPVIVVNPKGGSDLERREVFGPVVGARIFTSDQDGLELAARTARGLAGYVVTNDVRRIARAVEHLRVGILGINDSSPTTPEAPFGGLGDSGWGKEGGHLGLDEYLDRTFISLRLAPSATASTEGSR